MANSLLPSYVTKYFWGDNLDELDIPKNKHYIIKTILEKGDENAIKWLFSTIDRNTIKSTLPSLRLDKKSAYFWNIYLS